MARGAGDVELGRGYVTLDVEDTRYVHGMNRAESALIRLATKWNGSFPTRGVDRATRSLDSLERQARRATREVQSLASALASVKNINFRGLPAGANPAALLRAQAALIRARAQATRATTAATVASHSAPAAAAAAMARGAAARANAAAKLLDARTRSRTATTTAAASAAATTIRAHGQAAAGMVRAVGGAHAASIRAIGQAHAGATRARQATAIAAVRAVGSTVSSSIRSVASIGANTLRASSSVLRAVLSPLNAAIGGVTRIASSVLGRSSLFGGVGGGLLAGGVLGFSAKSAIELEARVANLGRIAGATDEQLKGLRSEMVRIAGSMAGGKITVGSVFDIATDASRMGVAREALPVFTRDIATLATAIDDMPIDQATNRIGRLLSVFRKGPEDALRFGSMLAKLDQMSNASASEILDVTTRSSGIVAAFKTLPSQAMALATAIRQSGIPIETGGTATSQILTRMASKRDMGQFAKIAGMKKPEFKQMLDSGHAVDALEKVLQGMKKINDEKGPVALSQALGKLHLDGQRVIGAFTHLVPVIGLLGEYTKAAAHEWESLDAVQAAYTKRSMTAEAQLQRMRNNFFLAAAAIGDRFLPLIKAAADALALLARDVDRHFSGEQGSAVQSWAEKAGRAIGWISTLWREFPTVLKLAKVEFAIALDQVATIAQNVVDYLQKNFEDLSYNIGTLIKNAFIGIAHFLDSTVGVIGRNAGRSLLEGFRTGLQKDLAKLLDIPGLTATLDAVFGGVGTPLRKLNEALSKKDVAGKQESIDVKAATEKLTPDAIRGGLVGMRSPAGILNAPRDADLEAESSGYKARLFRARKRQDAEVAAEQEADAAKADAARAPKPGPAGPPPARPVSRQQARINATIARRHARGRARQETANEQARQRDEERRQAGVFLGIAPRRSGRPRRGPLQVAGPPNLPAPVPFHRDHANFLEGIRDKAAANLRIRQRRAGLPTEGRAVPAGPPNPGNPTVSPLQQRIRQRALDDLNRRRRAAGLRELTMGDMAESQGVAGPRGGARPVAKATEPERRQSIAEKAMAAQEKLAASNDALIKSHDQTQKVIATLTEAVNRLARDTFS